MPNPATETIGPDHVVSEIFLTPRVIDAGAFGKYSAALRELIESGVATSARLSEERERAEAAIERAEGLAAAGEQSQTADAAKAARGSIEQTSIDRAAAVRIARLEATVAELAGRLEQAEASASEAKTLAREQQRGQAGLGEPSLDQADGGLHGSELTPEFDEALARAEAAEGRLRKLVGMAERAGEELSERVGDVVGKATSSGAELTAMIMMLAEQIERAEALGEIGGRTDDGADAGSEPLAAAPIDAETLRAIGELVERVGEAVRIASEKTERLESMNIRADASGEALLRAVRSATDGAVSAETIAEQLAGLIARAEAVGARITAPPTATPTVIPTPTAVTNESAIPPPVHPVSESAGDELAAGERLAMGSIGIPAEPSEVSVKPSGRDLRSFVERANAAEPIDTLVPGPSSGSPLIPGPSASVPRAFPPTPIDPAIVNRPQLRRLDRAIDAEDFGA
ncbi:MAG: hypothetical protein ACI89L_001804 [Phycisphaerales bacterium]|jgi:hypothetical protein